MRVWAYLTGTVAQICQPPGVLMLRLVTVVSLCAFFKRLARSRPVALARSLMVTYFIF